MMWSASITRGVACLGAALLIAGCMALPNADRTMFQEPPLPEKGTVPLKAGLAVLQDVRPAEQRAELPEIEEFPERITLEVLMDLSEARLFNSIGRDSRGADVLLRGEIRSFRWKPRYVVYPYIPAMGFLAGLGVPVSKSSSDVELAIDVVDAKNNQLIASYAKAARQDRSYWVYRYQDFTAGSDRDTDSAFRQVVEALQTAILADRDRIVETVKSR